MFFPRGIVGMAQNLAPLVERLSFFRRRAPAERVS
jgi:hypothetical protein